MNHNNPSDPKSPSYADVLPSCPNAELNANNAVPQAAAKELGDYAEGDYAVSVATQAAPSMEDSEFAQVSAQMSAQ